MTTQNPEPDLTPKQQFGHTLRALRDAAGMQSKDVAVQIGVSADLTSRIELGERWPKPEVAKAWARATGNAELAEELEQKLTELKDLESRLRADAQKPKLAQDLRSDLFRRASRIRTVAISEIPFYLQTAEYAREDVGDAAGAEDVVKQRRTDRESVGVQGKFFEILFAESALRYAPCSARAMRDQLSELQGLVGAARVEIGIIPFGKVSTPLKSAFSVFDDITIVESFAGAIDLTPKRAASYIQLMDRLWDEAVRGEQVREYLTAAVNAFAAS